MHISGFSVNLHDEDGDVYEKCILLHLENGVILQFQHIDAYDNFFGKMQSMRDELVRNL